MKGHVDSSSHYASPKAFHTAVHQYGSRRSIGVLIVFLLLSVMFGGMATLKLPPADRGEAVLVAVCSVFAATTLDLTACGACLAKTGREVVLRITEDGIEYGRTFYGGPATERRAPRVGCADH